MKKTIYAFAVISSMFLVACGSDNAEGSDESGEKKEQTGDDKEEASGPSIVGTWGLSDMDMGMEIPEEQQEMFDAMMEEMKANTTYVFTEDGKITMNTFAMGESMTQEGTYELDGNTLKTTVDGQSTEQEVKITDKTMSFSIEERGTTMSMTFTRK